MLVHQRGDALGLRQVDDLLDRILVDLLIVLIRDAQRDAHVVGADEDAVDARYLKHGRQVVHRSFALDADDADTVLVAVFQIGPGGIADVLSTQNHSLSGLTL